MVKLTLSSPLAQRLRCPQSSNIKTLSLMQLIQLFSHLYPQTRGHLVKNNGSLQAGIALFINDVLAHYDGNEDIELKPYDRVDMLLAMAGG